MPARARSSWRWTAATATRSSTASTTPRSRRPGRGASRSSSPCWPRARRSIPDRCGGAAPALFAYPRPRMKRRREPAGLPTPILRHEARAAAALGLAAALAAPGTARAADPGPRSSSLSWVRLAGAEACVGLRDVARAVEKRLGRPVFVAPTRADVAVEGRIERARPSGGWRAVITVSDERGAVRGTRELRTDAADCRALDDSIALALALMIDPDASLSAQPASA